MQTHPHRYNGWTNWATWNVALWLTSSDEGTYRQALTDYRWGRDTATSARRLLGDPTPDGAELVVRGRRGDGWRAEHAVNWGEIRAMLREMTR